MTFGKALGRGEDLPTFVKQQQVGKPRRGGPRKVSFSTTPDSLEPKLGGLGGLPRKKAAR